MNSPSYVLSLPVRLDAMNRSLDNSPGPIQLLRSSIQKRRICRPASPSGGLKGHWAASRWRGRWQLLRGVLEGELFFFFSLIFVIGGLADLRLRLSDLSCVPYRIEKGYRVDMWNSIVSDMS